MTTPERPVFIAAPIRAAVNRRAHAEGQRHAAEVRERLLEQIRRLTKDGAKYAELLAHAEESAP